MLLRRHVAPLFLLSIISKQSKKQPLKRERRNRNKDGNSCRSQGVSKGNEP
jgi:hypothetical protein